MIDTYRNHSPTKLNLFCACPSMFVWQYVLGNEQPVGAPAHRGTAVEAGLARGLLEPDTDISKCIKTAIDKYDALMALNTDERKDNYRTTIRAMVTQSLPILRQYGIPTSTQRRVEISIPGLSLPIVGYEDFAWAQHGICADLKTTEKCPSAIKIGHARQVALYTESDNADARLIYVTPKKMEVYSLENIRAHRMAAINIARRIELFLSLSDDPEFYTRILAPDLESFYWNKPELRTVAYQHWAI